MKSISLDEEIIVTEYKEKAKDPIIMVMGVGGGGGNIVTQMYQETDFGGVSYVLCNTDKQDLFNKHMADHKIQLGISGLGAGANMKKGQLCAEYPKTQEEIKECLTAERTIQMLFIVATLGGGTGTGAAPVIARIAKEIEIDTEDIDEKEKLLVVGVVTLPSRSEGEGSMQLALAGLKELMEHTDAVIIIHNEGIRKAVDPKTPYFKARQLQNQIPIQAVKAISWIVNETLSENPDFSDIRTILRGGETALISIGYGSGENRVKDAIYQVTHSPFLQNRDIFKAKSLMYGLFDNSKEEGDEVALTADELENIISSEFVSHFRNIESDPEGRFKKQISYVNSGFPEFEKKNIKEKDTIGLIVLAAGFMFQEDEVYDDPSDWGDYFGNTATKEVDLKKELYKKTRNAVEDNINLTPRTCLLPPTLLDDEKAIQLLEKDSPAFRGSDFKEKYQKRIKEQKRPNPLDNNLSN